MKKKSSSVISLHLKIMHAYVAKWLLRQHLDNKHRLCMEVGKSGCPFTRVGGPRQQNHHAMNVRILSNPHAKQKKNEKQLSIE
jgi:hypothetical protein